MFLNSSSLADSEIGELKKALKEYRTTLDKARSQQRLNNYHRMFKKQLSSKLQKNHDKQLTKIGNTIEPSLSSVNNIEIYSILFQLRNRTLPLKVPTTLYLSQHLRFLIKSGNTLEFITGPEIISVFLNTLPAFSGVPICIFKPLNGKLKLFGSFLSVRDFLRDNKNNPGFFQHFIASNSKIASILMVYAKRNTLNKYVAFTNNTDFHLLNKDIKERGQSIIINQDSEKVISAFIQDIVSRSSTNKVLRRQFTFELPDTESLSVSCIDDEKPPMKCNNFNFTNLIQRINYSDIQEDDTTPNQARIEKNSKSYIVNLRNIRDTTLYQIKNRIPEIEKMTKCIFSVLVQYFAKKSDRNVQEMNIIYIKDSNNEWSLLKIKDIKFQKPLDYVCTDKIEIALDNSFHLSFDESSKILNNTFIPLVESFTHQVEQKKTKIKIKDIKAIKAKSLPKHRKKSVSLKLNEDTIKYVNQAVKKFDTLKLKARMNKSNFVDLNIKYSASVFWKELSIKVHKTLINSHIAKYFMRVNSETFTGISKALFIVFCSDFSLKFTKEIQQIHKPLMITDQDFDIFVKTFLAHLIDYNIQNNDTEIISANLEFMRSFIVIR